MTAPASPFGSRPRVGSFGQEYVLLGLMAAEVAFFAVVGKNFFTAANAFEIIRLGTEVGLLALALTPVIIAGGIDLSVGSLMGLSAVVLGLLWRDAGWPLPLAVAASLGLGGLAGWANGWLVTRLKLPPLIVTLATFSLFRGLAEGLTGGVENFTAFPPWFLFLGQGYLPGGIPAQFPLLLVAAAGVAWMLHRAPLGRELVAIGLAPEGARFAGIDVDRRLRWVYTLCGLSASLAALVYVAHLGQAKADAGTGYELMAITAVVLGGTSITGGQGSAGGTLLGLLAIVTLQNGLRLAAWPAELAGILIGGVLLVTMTLSRLRAGPRPTATGGRGDLAVEPWQVTNGQMAALCGTILLAAVLVALSQQRLAHELARSAAPAARSPALGEASAQGQAAAAGSTSPSHALLSPGGRPLVVAMMPKSKGNAYFIACRRGAEQAAEELGIELIWDGPTETDPAKQNEIVEAWITRGVDVIAVAVENRQGLSSVLRKARQRGIRVLTWDADADPDARDFLVNQATPEGIGTALMDQAARVLGGAGEFAIITASLTAANQIEWQKHIEARRTARYPQIRLATVRPCDDQQGRAFEEATTILRAYPQVKLIMAICSPAVPGAAEAVKQARRDDVKVIGLGLPNDNKPYVHAGITDCVILWNTMDLGYLTVWAAQALCAGTLRPGVTEMTAGRLGRVVVAQDQVLLGQPLVFTRDNIDQYDF
jgi:rhamnose transport system permease protein